jgi:hypothetical protein
MADSFKIKIDCGGEDVTPAARAASGAMSQTRMHDMQRKILTLALRSMRRASMTHQALTAPTPKTLD